MRVLMDKACIILNIKAGTHKRTLLLIEDENLVLFIKEQNMNIGKCKFQLSMFVN